MPANINTPSSATVQLFQLGDSAQLPSDCLASRLFSYSSLCGSVLQGHRENCPAKFICLCHTQAHARVDSLLCFQGAEPLRASTALSKCWIRALCKNCVTSNSVRKAASKIHTAAAYISFSLCSCNHLDISYKKRHNLVLFRVLIRCQLRFVPEQSVTTRSLCIQPSDALVRTAVPAARGLQQESL